MFTTFTLSVLYTYIYITYLILFLKDLSLYTLFLGQSRQIFSKKIVTSLLIKHLAFKIFVAKIGVKDAREREMDYLKNHCWCSDSIWGGMYDCSIIVSLDCYSDCNKKDWDNVLTQEKHFSQKQYEKAKEIFVGKPYYTDDFHRSYACRTINVPKPEVVQWLQENVAPGEFGEPMFAYGSKDYSAEDGANSYSFFFQRRKDAMKFIKTWSVYRRPVYYIQYFTDVRLKLNLETLKYERR